MQILQTARWFFPHVGGASSRVYNTAKNLIASGHEVHLLVHNPKSIKQCSLKEEAPPQEEYEGIHVHRLPYFAPTQLYWAATIPLMAKAAADIIKKEKIDVILSHNPPYLVGASSLLAGRFTKTPVVINAHDVWGASHYTSLQSKVGAVLEKECIRRAKKVIVPCRGLDDVLMKRTGAGRERFAVAPTGVDTDTFRPTDAPEDVDALFLGNLAPWSGCEYFVAAANRLLEKDERLKFRVVGDGIERKKLTDTAKPGIEFTGAVPAEKLPDLINSAKVCVSSFPKPETVKRDTCIRPISTLEFMACGKPAVVSDVAGIRDFLTDEVNGLLYEPENVAELAEKIRYLLDNEDARKRIGAAARKTAVESCGWKASVRIIEKALLESIGRSQGN